MSEIKMEGKIEDRNSITERTPIILPLRLQIALWVSIIIVTAGTVGSYLNATNAIDKVAIAVSSSNDKIKELKDSKLDKVTYENDRKHDEDDREDMKRWMALIMDKLEIMDYGQKPKTRLPKYEKPAGDNRQIDSLRNEVQFYKSQYEEAKKDFNKGMGVDK